MTKKITVVISQDRVLRPLRPTVEGDLLAALSPRPNMDVAVLPHLYDLEPEGAGMRYLQSIGGDMIVLAWLSPRAIYWLLDANGVKGRLGVTAFFSKEEAENAWATPRGEPDHALDRTIWCLDVRSPGEAGPLLAEIERIAREATGEPHQAAVAAAPGHAGNGTMHLAEETRFRWYPVVDYSRCTNCLECLNFCLFGTFGLDESGRLFVEQPDTCRNGCPACSRVCPCGAIMFPHHGDAAISGDPHAPLPGFNLDMVRMFQQSSPADLAAAERDCALAEKAAMEAQRAEDAIKENAHGTDSSANGIDSSAAAGGSAGSALVGGTDSSAIGVPQAQEVLPTPRAADAAQSGKLAGPPLKSDCPPDDDALDKLVNGLDEMDL